MAETLRHRVVLVEEGSDSLAKKVDRLLYYAELEDWQKDNHFIRSGYVKTTLSYRESLRSLMYLHNETVNIYTHLLPCLVLFASIGWYVEYKLEAYENSLGIIEKLNFYQFAIGGTICLAMSSSFHTMKSHSLEVCSFGNKLDYFGIVILITTSLNSIIMFAYQDYPVHKYGYITLFLTLALICTNLTLNPHFSKPRYRPFRSLMFILFGLSGVVPILGAIYQFGFEKAMKRSSAGWLMLEGICYISGAVIYAMRIPERFVYKELEDATSEDLHKTAMFDIIGHSHQIFHVMVIGGLLCHWMALVNCYHHLHRVTLIGEF